MITARYSHAFTLIELMIVVAIIAALSAVAIPNLLSSRISANETAAIATCRFFCTAQTQFMRTDWYQLGTRVYANQDDGLGYVDLFQIGGIEGDGEHLGLIDRSIANAWYGMGDQRSPRSGYLFEDIVHHHDGEEFDYGIECGLQAFPVRPGNTGRNMFVAEITGLIYATRVTEEVVPDQTFPDIDDGWMLMGSN